MKLKTKYDVISPDGFPIERVGFYNSKKQAIAAFEAWKKQFEAQGYYSSNNGRISLKDLADECTWVEV